MSEKRKVDQSWFNAKSVEYETPDEIFQPLEKEFGMTLDVSATNENAKCKKFLTIDDDGLACEWDNKNWMNPPFGRVMQKWVRKAHAEFQNGKMTVALIPARTNTKWWHECVQDIAEVRFIRGEVKFKGFERGLWMPMCIVIWNPANAGMSGPNGQEDT